MPFSSPLTMLMLAISRRTTPEILFRRHRQNQQEPDLKRQILNSMVSDLEDSGSRSSREVSPASSSSITSIIIQVTTTRYQFSEPLPSNVNFIAQPNPPAISDQGLTTVMEEPTPNAEDDPAPPYSLTPPNSSPANDPTQPPSDGITATAAPAINITDSEGTVTAPIILDEPLVAPLMTRSSPTLRRSYIIRTKWHTLLSRFREFIESLPDGGNGVVLIVESLPWQKYITMLNPAEVEEVRQHEIVAAIEPDVGFPLAEEIQRH